MKRKPKKYFINLLIVIAVLVILVLYVFLTYGTDTLVALMHKIQYHWIITAFYAWLFSGLATPDNHIIARKFTRRQSFITSVKYSMVGVFFNTITPFASGGQPAQVYVMSREGIKPGHAVSIMLVKSVTYQGMVVLYSLLVILFKKDIFMAHIPGIFYLYIAGFLANLVVVGMYLLFFFRNESARKLIMFIFNLVRKIRLLRALTKYEKKLEYELEAFERGARLLKNNAYLLFNTCLVQIMRLSLFFSIPYFILISMEPQSRVNIWDMVAAQSIVTMISSYIPSPGAAGGAEGTAYVFFKLFFGTGFIIPAIIIWRIITYYLSILFGGVVSLLIPQKPIKEIV